MTLVSLSAYAKLHGTSRQAATAWKAHGALSFEGKLVDVEKSDVCMKRAGLGRYNDGGGHGGKRSAVPPATLPTRLRVDRLPHERAKPWRTQDPCSLGAQIELAAQSLASRFVQLRTVPSEISELMDLADDAMFGDHEVRCEAAGWFRWPDQVAALIAADIGMSERTQDLHASLERHVANRLRALDRDPDDFTDMTIEAR